MWSCVRACIYERVLVYECVRVWWERGRKVGKGEILLTEGRVRRETIDGRKGKGRDY